MNLLGIFGFICGVAALVFGMVSSGNPISSFIDYPSLAIILVGTFGILTMSFPYKVIKNVPKMFLMFLMPKKYKPEKYMDKMVEFSRIARGNGILALEERAKECDEPLIKSSFLIILNAKDSEKAKDMLDDAIDFMCQRHKENWSFFNKMSRIAPGLGMIASLVLLIKVFLKIGESTNHLDVFLGTALFTTLYGCILACFIALPIANRLKTIHNEEVLCMKIVQESALAIVLGESPIYIEEKLRMMIPKRKKSLKTIEKQEKVGIKF